ncbi:MAG: DsrE family protein [Acidiferrobacteraceae bacterium]
MRRTLQRMTVACLLLLSSACMASLPVPTFPGVPPVPHVKGLNFDGFFKRHQPVKLVFGISNPGAQMKESLTNAALVIQYLRRRGYPYHVEVVLYGKAVLAVDSWKQRYSVYQDLVTRLNGAGVQFRVCYNSMYTLHVKPKDLYPFVKIVPAGILQLVKKQMQGYTVILNQ